MNAQLPFPATKTEPQTAQARRTAPTYRTRAAVARPAPSPRSQANLARVRQAKQAKAQAASLQLRTEPTGRASGRNPAWWPDDATRAVGRAGVASAREALAEARRAAYATCGADFGEAA